MDLFRQKTSTLLFHKTTVISETGSFIPITREQSVTQFLRRINRETSRAPSAVYNTGRGTTNDVVAPYVQIRLVASNEILTYKRHYISIVDVIASVGGVINVVIFLAGILYAWYNQIIFS